jgi:ATP-dependent Lhr-like helicase
MTNSSPSSSSDPPISQAFARLHPTIQRWIWDKGWHDLRTIQEQAAEPILLESPDVIITAPTAGGKTEAAFLPILSKVAERPAAGVRVLYLSPLRALINDQFDRLEDLGKRLDLPFHRWHGDVSSSSKHRVLADPAGVLLTTPESLEAMFVLRGSLVAQFFAGLTYVVVDELHAFIGTERGTQLQSLLHRVELAVGRRVPRIALSATLGDMRLAAQALRPNESDRVRIVEDKAEGRGIKLRLRGFMEQFTELPSAGERRGDEDDEHEESQQELPSSADEAIADMLFRQLRGKKNLVFANARSAVERYSDLLRRRCEKACVPQEFWPHHGSLSRELREDVERMLKERDRPITGVCTSTLELGIDIGAVESVAQVGVPPSVASLQQRLGRSGRKADQEASLRVFIKERPRCADMLLEDELRLDLVQTVATINLLLRKWYEPPATGALHLSTLVHQVLALIAQHGGIAPDRAWTVLCGTGSAFAIDRTTFVRVLRSMGENELLTQAADGTLLAGRVGDQKVNHYSFFAVFATPQEYRLVSDGHTLGTLPISYPVAPSQLIIFGGRRWLVLDVDDSTRTIQLKPSRGGNVPLFGGGGIRVHDEIRHEMRRIYSASDLPAYLDGVAISLLQEARQAFADLHLDKTNAIQRGRSAYLVCWEGDRTVNTLQLLLVSLGVPTERSGPILSTEKASSDDVARLVSSSATDALDLKHLATFAKNKVENKYDCFLAEDLLCLEYASRELAPLPGSTSR